jgi:hypothetical protein
MNEVKLSKREIAVALRQLKDWSVVKGKLHREFKFKDFTEAFAFMKRVALGFFSLRDRVSDAAESPLTDEFVIRVRMIITTAVRSISRGVRRYS